MKALRLDKFIAGGLLLAVAFTALTHGAVAPWSIAIFELLIILLVVVWLIKSLVEKRFDLKIPATLWPLAAFFVYGLIQSISIKNGAGQISSLSFDPEATRNTVFVLFFLIVSYLIAANFFASEKRLQVLVKFMMTFGFALSVLGLIQFFTKESIFFWSRPEWAKATFLNGPFVNYNHFAGYLELIIPLPIALVLTGAVRQTRMLYGFAAVVMVIAVVFSGSRGGMISLTVALLFIAVAGLNYTRVKRSSTEDDPVSNARQSFFSWSLFRNLASVVIIIGAIIGGVIWLGSDPVIDRLSNNDLVSADENAQTFEDARGWIWKNSLTVFRANTVFGTGMGTFETAFPQYSEGYPAAPDGKLLLFAQSHNDYLQLLADTGLIGASLAFWFIVTVGFAIKRGMDLKDPFRAGLAIGCGGAILSLLIHSVFDFNLQLPSTSLLFLILAAISTNLTAIKVIKPKS